MGRVVLNTDIADADLRAAIFRQVLSEDELAVAVDDAERITRPLDDNYFDLLGERYSHLRQFAPALLDALSLRGSAPDDDLLDAIDLLRRLNHSGRRRVADRAPTNFVPARWQSYVIDADGRIDRRYYELCALWELRAALRAGDVWVDGSRRYANPETYLIPRETVASQAGRGVPTDWYTGGWRDAPAPAAGRTQGDPGSSRWRLSSERIRPARR